MSEHQKLKKKFIEDITAGYTKLMNEREPQRVSTLGVQSQILVESIADRMAHEFLGLLALVKQNEIENGRE